MSGRKGFTLTEVMIVVGIVGLVAAIAILNSVKAKNTAEKYSCIVNLKQIQNAEARWAIDNAKNTGDTPTVEDLSPDYIKNWPKCKNIPYEPPAVDDTPVCPNNTAGHTLS